MRELVSGQEIEVLPELPDGVICSLHGAAGEPAGTASVREQRLPLIGGRQFWLYTADLPADAQRAADAMFNASFEVLDGNYQSARSGPIGMARLVSDPDEMRRRPEAIWPETRLMYAGTRPDGRHLRIRYFWDATVGPGFPNSPTLEETISQEYPLGEGYRIVPLAETDEVGPADVLTLWTREGVVPGAEARRRVGEVQLVAIAPGGSVAGVSTAYLRHNPQLRMDLWYYRTFVSREHRLHNLAAQLIFENRDLLERRFVSGEDTRAGGILVEVENEGMRRYFNRAWGMPSDFTFVGETDRGAHVGVHYFPGARAPGPR